MYCWKCGKENRDSAAFCRYCGVSLDMATKNRRSPKNDQLSKDAADKTLDLILAVSIDKSQYYKALLNEIVEKFDTLENANNLVEEATGKYLKAVAFSVFDIFIQQSSDFRPLIQEALENPAIFGYEDIDFSLPSSFIGGIVYAICYWAITGEFADPGDCIQVNRGQRMIINDAMHELDEELSNEHIVLPFCQKEE